MTLAEKLRAALEAPRPVVARPSIFRETPKPPKVKTAERPKVKALSLELLKAMGEDTIPIDRQSKLGKLFRRHGVSASKELDRIVTIPRRASSGSYTDLTPVYGKIGSTWRLWQIQNAALHEAKSAGGLLAPIGVGHGKTIISLLVGKHMEAERVVLLVPPQLRVQLIKYDIPRLNKEFFLPLELLNVVAYSELSSASNADVLDRLSPDLIVADECHHLRHRSAARTKRFLRFMRATPGCRFVGLSGTITRRSIRDFAHLSELALRSRSPVPLDYHTLNEWAEAIDVGKDPLPAGELAQLCNDEELTALTHTTGVLQAQPIIREAFRRRLVETPGVVATEEGAIGTSLVLRGLRPKVPAEVQIALSRLRDTWEIGEEELVSILDVTRVGCQLAGGFYYRWVWPKDETGKAKKDYEWLEARKEWHKELREILKLSRAGLDSPLLVENAIRRGELESTCHAEWARVKPRYNPTPPREAVWIDDYLVKEAVKWGKDCTKAEPGIIWFLWKELGEKISKAGGFPFIGGGADEELANVEPRKTPVIVASQRAHGTGKNLQTFCKNLFTTPMAGGAEFEQTLARTHRPNQVADEVTADIFVHTQEMERCFSGAMKDAQYIQDSQGQKQKLLFAERIDLPDGT